MMILQELRELREELRDMTKLGDCDGYITAGLFTIIFIMSIPFFIVIGLPIYCLGCLVSWTLKERKLDKEW